jgi:hypothetical protein
MKINRIIDEFFATGAIRAEGRSPYLAFLVGLVFGAAGLGIYLRSLLAFLVTMGIFVPLYILLEPYWYVPLILMGVWGGLAVNRAQKRELASETIARQGDAGQPPEPAPFVSLFEEPDKRPLIADGRRVPAH